MAMLSPKFLILDETDSGLDIDALKIVSEGVNALRAPERGMLVITHYQRLLDYIKPDRVHVLAAGRIVASGGPELALQLEAEGYDKYASARHEPGDRPQDRRPDPAAVAARRGLALDRPARPDPRPCRRPRRR
jgi:Fe-S cluster assembly ATPase SufC